MTKLNDDCWWYVVNETSIAGDYRTLGRLLLTSKILFRMVLPVMYGQVFAPINTVKQRWSKRKTHHLLALILLSHGLVNKKGHISDKIEYIPRGKEVIDRKHVVIMADMPDIALPTTVDYFTYLKYEPLSLAYVIKWKRLGCGRRVDSSDMRFTDVYRYQLKKIEAQFSHLCTELIVRPKEHKDLMIQVELLPRLKRMGLLCAGYLGQEAVDLLIDFIRAHKKLFPGVLQHIDGLPTLDVLPVYRVLEPTEIVDHTEYWRYFDRKKDASLEWLHRLEVFSCSYNKPEDGGASIIQHAPKLRRLMCKGVARGTNSPAPLFAWATSGNHNQGTESLVLPPIQDITLTGACLYSARDALRLFKNSLQLVTLQDQFQRNPVTFFSQDWCLPQVKYLELENIAVDLTWIESCPKLKVLKVISQITFDSKPWNAPLTLNELYLSGPAALSLDLVGLQAAAGQLRILQLDFTDEQLSKETQDDTGHQSHTNCLQNARGWVDWLVFERLKVLRLKSAAVVSCSKLLSLSPNLRHFSADPQTSDLKDAQEAVFEPLRQTGLNTKLEVLEFGSKIFGKEILLWLANNDHVPNLWALNCGIPLTDVRDLSSKDERDAFETIMSRPKMEVIKVQKIFAPDLERLDCFGDNFGGRFVFPAGPDEVMDNPERHLFCLVISEAMYDRSRFTKRGAVVGQMDLLFLEDGKRKKKSTDVDDCVATRTRTAIKKKK